jgi:hypothetical protein
MIPFAKQKIDEAKAVAARAEELNRKADTIVDPIAAKVITSRYTVVILVLSAVFAFAAGFATAQAWF